MCSLTWLRTPDGYELFFNRDESLQRLAALPPAPRRHAGVEYLAALDADAGGTWLALNAFGLTLGLLNGQPAQREPPRPISRGLLVLELVDAPDTVELERRLAAHDLARHRPFQLVALEPARPLLQACWDGERLQLARLEDAQQPLSSSSLEPLGAGNSRRRLLRRLLDEARGPSEEVLLAFHASHEPTAGATSPCMHRADAETVSFTRTRVTAGAVELGYSPAAPCRGQPLTWLGLERLPLEAPRGPRPADRPATATRPPSP